MYTKVPKNLSKIKKLKNISFLRKEVDGQRHISMHCFLMINMIQTYILTSRKVLQVCIYWLNNLQTNKMASLSTKSIKS